MAGLLCGFVFTATLSNKYGAEAVGIYQISVQFILVVSMISLAGFNQAIIRFSSELASKNNISELISLLVNYSLVAFVFSVIISSFTALYSKDLAVYLFKNEALSGIFVLISISIPIYALNLLCVEFLRGLRKIKISESLRLFSIRFLNLVLFLLLVSFFDFRPYSPVLSYEIAILLTFALSLLFVVKTIRSKKEYTAIEECPKNKHYFSASFTMYQSILLMLASSYLMVFMLAYYTNPVEVGIYNIAFQLAALTTFVFGAVTTITAPKFSELYSSDINQLKSTVMFSSKLIFWTTGILSIITIVLSGWLLSLFGKEFQSGQIILVILSVGNLVNATTGPSGVLLDMVGKQHIRRNILLTSTVVTVVLSVILIGRFGAVGLAYALLASSIMANGLGVIYVNKILDISLIYIPFITREKN
jgi:O-antigen/teichoic acid export membrane protein